MARLTSDASVEQCLDTAAQTIVSGLSPDRQAKLGEDEASSIGLGIALAMWSGWDAKIILEVAKYAISECSEPDVVIEVNKIIKTLE